LTAAAANILSSYLVLFALLIALVLFAFLVALVLFLVAFALLRILASFLFHLNHFKITSNSFFKNS
jgi:hypothetical protein